MHRLDGTGILLISITVLLFSCGAGNGETKEAVSKPQDYKTFSYSDAEVNQVLQLKWHNDTALSFVLEHHQGDCNYTLSGDAVNPYITYDPESDTDQETGETYWVDLYLYNRGDCRMALRVAQDTTKAQLQLANCAASPSCAIESRGILRRNQ